MRHSSGGERTVTNTCPQNNYKFEGKERDTETGNDDFGARYYSNRFGRWLSADWSAVPVPVPYANLTNPQTLNLYAMVADDPESFADLDGHQCIFFGLGGRTCNFHAATTTTVYQDQNNNQQPPTQQQTIPVSKSTYKTATQAATAALDAITPESEKSGWEYAGRIVKLKSGKFAYTLPTTKKSSTESDPDAGMEEGRRIPAGTTNAGIYHTHPSSCVSCAHEQFSAADNAGAVREHVPSYIESGATRSIYLLDGSKRTSILDPRPPTVIRRGPPPEDKE